MSDFFSISMKVRFSDTDPAQIMYFGNYPGYFDESFIEAMRQSNISWDDRKTMNFLMPIVEQKVQYFHPLIAGDTVKIYMTVDMIGKKVFRTQYLMTKDNTKIATGYITHVTVSYKEFKSIPIPDKFKNVLKKFYIDESKWNNLILSYE